MDPQKLNMEAATITAVVEFTARMMVPIVSERMNCAKNTMLLTMPTSVPIPLTNPSAFFSSTVLFLSSSEYF